MALQKWNHFALKTNLLDEKVVAKMKHIPANLIMNWDYAAMQV